MIKRLHVGETYILREEFAPYGYSEGRRSGIYNHGYCRNSESGNEG